AEISDRNLFVGEIIRSFLGKLAYAAEDLMVVGGPFNLALEHGKAVAFDAGIHEEHVFLQRKKPLGGEGGLRYVEFAIAAKVDQASASIGCDDLVLISTGFLKDVALEIDGFVRQCFGRAEPALIRIKRLQHRHHKA